MTACHQFESWLSPFGVKAGAVRDALLAAQAKGLVKVLPRVGAIVHPEADSPDAATVAANSFVDVVGQPDQNLFMSWKLAKRSN